MKIAMIDVDRELRKRGLRSRIVLQIHDELLIEAPLEEEEEVKNLLTDRMKHAASLQVALEVEAQTGAPGLMPNRTFRRTDDGRKQTFILG